MPATVIKGERCWDIADRAIAGYWVEVKAARAEGDVNRERICQEMIDEWLEYRREHKASDTDVI
jgi:hypothetical protein